MEFELSKTKARCGFSEKVARKDVYGSSLERLAYGPLIQGKS